MRVQVTHRNRTNAFIAEFPMPMGAPPGHPNTMDKLAVGGALAWAHERRLQLRDLDFTHGVFNGLDLAGLSATECHFSISEFIQTNLAGAIFHKCCFANCIFIQANLVGATFIDCDIVGASFVCCDRRYVRWEGIPADHVGKAISD